jgi:hypothetical protein
MRWRSLRFALTGNASGTPDGVSDSSSATGTAVAPYGKPHSVRLHGGNPLRKSRCFTKIQNPKSKIDFPIPYSLFPIPHRVALYHPHPNTLRFESLELPAECVRDFLLYAVLQLEHKLIDYN